MLTSAAEEAWTDPERELAEPIEAHPVIEPGPCEGCIQARRCAAQLLACDIFQRFVEHGGADRWPEVPRRPERRIFDRLFPDPIERALTRSSASL